MITVPILKIIAFQHRKLFMVMYNNVKILPQHLNAYIHYSLFAVCILHIK